MSACAGPGCLHPEHGQSPGSAAEREAVTATLRAAGLDVDALARALSPLIAADFARSSRRTVRSGP